MSLGGVPAPWPTGHSSCTPGVSCPQGPRGICLQPSGGFTVPILPGVSHPQDPRDIIPVPHGVSLSPPGYPQLPPNPKASHPCGPRGHCPFPPGGCPCCPGGCAVPIPPGILSLFPQECPTASSVSLFPPRVSLSPRGVPSSGPEGRCPHPSPQGCPYPVRGVPVPMELLSPIQISSSPPSHRDHQARSGGGARTGRGHPWGRGSDLVGVAKGGAPACGARLHARPHRPAQRHFRFLPAGSAASLAAMASRLLRVSAALRLLPAASARAVPARNLGVPGERGRGKRGNGGEWGRNERDRGWTGAGCLHPRCDGAPQGSWPAMRNRRPGWSGR